jgi:hypothetical protein
MLLHQFVLSDDNRIDLADPDKAGKWLAARPWWPQFADSTSDWQGYWPGWPIGYDGCWTQNVHALRFWARRLGLAQRVRRSRIDYAHAQYVLQTYFGMLRVRVDRPVKGELSRTNPPVAAIVPGHPETNSFLKSELEQFWQGIFYSLVAAGGPRVCSVCGKILPATTKKGRPSRRTTCGRCSWRRWHSGLPVSARRTRWRRDKRTQRRTRR